MSFELRADGVDVSEVMRHVRDRIEAKKRAGLFTQAELDEIASRRLHAVLDPHDVGGGLLDELLARPDAWGFRFDAESVYRSSRGGAGRLLERVRRLLRPIQKLFWNPTPMIAALSRQADLNVGYAHLLHNAVLEMTRLNLEVQDLRHRTLQLQAQLDFQARRAKALEALVRDSTPGAGAP